MARLTARFEDVHPIFCHARLHVIFWLTSLVSADSSLGGTEINGLAIGNPYLIAA